MKIKKFEMFINEKIEENKNLSKRIELFDYSIENMMPDESIKGNILKCMKIAQNLDTTTYNLIGKKVHDSLKGTHFTESDYQSSIGNVYNKIITNSN